MAQDAAEDPLVQEEIERRERDSQHAQQDVRQGQISDEQIRHRLHGLVVADDEANQDVAADADAEDDHVQGVDVGLHGRMLDQVQHGRRVVGHITDVLHGPEQANRVKLAANKFDTTKKQLTLLSIPLRGLAVSLKMAARRPPRGHFSTILFAIMDVEMVIQPARGNRELSIGRLCST